MIKGRLRLMAGDGLNAIGAFRTVVAEKPEFTPAYIHMSQAHLVNQEPALALDTLRRALKNNPQSQEIRVALARLHASRKEFDQAEALLREALETNPDDHRVRADLGDLLVMSGHLDEAHREYRLIETKAPTLPVGYIKQAQLYLRQKAPRQAVTVLETGAVRNPESVPLFTSLVSVYLAIEDFDRAAALCRDMIGRHPQNPIPLNAMGNVLMARKDYAQAQDAFEKAIALQPLWQPPHNGLARAYLAQNNTAEAIKQLETSIRENSRNTAAFMTLGHLYEQQKDYARARRVYEKALQSNPNLWPAANNLAFLISETSPPETDLTHAADLARLALKQQPDNPVVLDTVGWIHYRQGNLPQAFTYIEKAIERDQTSPILHYHLATVLHQTGRSGEARIQLEQALATDKDFHGRGDAERLMVKLKARS